MPVSQSKKGEEKDDNPHKHQKDAPQSGHNIEHNKRKDAESDGPNQREDGQEGEQKKEQKAPAIHVASPASGSAFPTGGIVPFDFECEGEGQFDAQMQVYDKSGNPVQSSADSVKLDEHGKGHGHMNVSSDWLGAGKYEVHLFGSCGGVMSPIQKVQIELVDEGKQQEAEPAPAQEGDVVEVKGGGV
jgi:hypothetical protein